MEPAPRLMPALAQAEEAALEGPGDGVLEARVSAFARVAALHRELLEREAAIERRFLEGRGAALRALLARAASTEGARAALSLGAMAAPSEGVRATALEVEAAFLEERPAEGPARDAIPSRHVILRSIPVPSGETPPLALEEVTGPAPPPAPALPCRKPRLGAAEVRAFAEGRTFECFGEGFERALCHVHAPRVPSGEGLLLEEATRLDARSLEVSGRPLPSGASLLDGALQAMALLLAAHGLTLPADGARFAPLPGEPFRLRRPPGPLPPGARLRYEVRLRSLEPGPRPVLRADVRCTADGTEALLARGLALALVPDVPLARRPDLLARAREDRPAARHDGVLLDERAFLAAAWGRPGDAFGARLRRFDDLARPVPRAPGPPFLLMSRATRLEAPEGAAPGAEVEIEVDVPADAWYLPERAGGEAPFCVLLEMTLQPPGWLAIALGLATEGEERLRVRNLDGRATFHAPLGREARAVVTRTRLTRVSRSGDVTVFSASVEARDAAGRPLATVETSYGLFPDAALEEQVGIPPAEAAGAGLDAPGARPVALPARLAARAGEPSLRMLDRVSGFWPEAGAAGLGRLRAERDISPGDWFFRAHFHGDPVQPGCLGLQAIVEALEACMAARGLAEGIPGARFEPIALEAPLAWKFRGQVLPSSRRVVVEVELTRIVREEGGAVLAAADGWLSVDGMCIYAARGAALRIVPLPLPAPADSSFVLDPSRDLWLKDHAPTYGAPALALACVADRLAAAAEAAAPPGLRLRGLRDVWIAGWIVLDRPRRLRTAVRPATGDGGELEVALSVGEDASAAPDPFLEPAASARALLARDLAPAPAPLEPLRDPAPAPDLYESGAQFHGPAFRVVRRPVRGANGDSAALDAGGDAVPRGPLHAALLDGVLQTVRNDDLGSLLPEVGPEHVAFPHRIGEVLLHGPLPSSGEATVEVRPDGFEGGPKFPAFRAQVLSEGRVRLSLRVVFVALPAGPFGPSRRRERRAFLRDGAHVEGLGLSREEGGATRLSRAEADALSWMPAGGIAAVYGAAGSPEEVLRAIAVKDHVARRARVHPREVEPPEEDPAAEAAGARVPRLPLSRFPVRCERERGAVRVEDAGPEALDLAPARRAAVTLLGEGPWSDIYFGLADRFVRRVVLADPAAFDAHRGRPVIYLANHQVAVESLAFSALALGLAGIETVTVAKAEHRESWVGWLAAHAFASPGVRDPRPIEYLERGRGEAALEIADALRARRSSVLVHVEGTRARSCRRPVERLSSVFLDLALALEAPVVPVRFSGGLPIEEARERLDFPLGYAAQDIHLGRPIAPEELRALAYAERPRRVLEALNALGPGAEKEAPHAPDPAFAAEVGCLRERFGVPEAEAVLLAVLERRAEAPGASPETRALALGARRGRLEVGDDARGRWLAALARRLMGARGPEATACRP
jgi:3-hydroxymyristoyl/3-hydroxydecanoyl-(acyl carrier protein) dehydratase/1-acyl-sn-glycerol-3-phosphate acyltransferase